EQDTRNSDRSRFQQFRRLAKVALFNEIQFTALDKPTSAHHEVTRRSAAAALSVFAASGLGDSWALAPLPATVSPAEQEESKEACFERLLTRADSMEQPEQGLRLLDQASRLRPVTQAYHRRRAACLSRRGDHQGAEQEQRKAEATALSTAFDYFLIGKES